MRVNAIEENWQPMMIKGITGLYNDMRIDRDTVPDAYHFWELADDSDGTPCRYQEGILVNFYGTFITKGELPFEQVPGGLKHGYIDPDEYQFGAEKSIEGRFLKG